MFSKMFSSVLVLCLTSVFARSENYLGPEELVFLEDGTLAVMEMDAGKITFFSLEQKKAVGEVRLEKTPNRMIRGKSGLYVSCGDLNGEVVKIDPSTRKILKRWTGMHSPWGLAVSEKKRYLFVGRKFHGDILVLDETKEGAWEKTLVKTVPVVREPTAMVLVPDESELYVANRLPLEASDGSTVSCCVSVVHLETLEVTNEPLPDGVNNMRDITCSPDGRYLFVSTRMGTIGRLPRSFLAGGRTATA